MKRVIGSLILTAMLCGCSSTQLPENLPNEKQRIAAIGKYLTGHGKVESVEKIKVNNVELLLIRYVLTPTPQSYIRCGVALPMPEVWSGRFIGIGNTGFPENYPEKFYNWVQLSGSTGFTQHLAGKNNVVAITDMGFSRHREKNPEVWKDFGFRSTHLMTVTAKEIIKLYYGRKSDYNYFFGLSTGGGKGLHEAQKFPEDYDGIISVVPASTRLYLLASNLHVYRTLHDKNGKKLFNNKHLQVIRKAAVKYFADKGPAYARGRFIADPRYTPEAARGVARMAAELDKTITPDMEKRIEKLFGPIYIGNRYAGNSVPAGGANLHSVGVTRTGMLNMFYGKEFDITKCDIDKDLEDIFKVMSPIFNAENPDLSAFRKRGGKLIVYSGTEDDIVPYFGMLDYYQRASAAAGGVDELKENFLYYILPGRSHVSGSGIRTLK
ncbi:MAG: tannase/feruloyl esterase family alpha/beta hydrolase, partial [Lentisphaeria bacterium]|nr:tannase/feruloyl esterase family alpha/beta hydrolase [Lentisphaeria bacterium]